jgi:hypothetical protein
VRPSKIACISNLDVQVSRFGAAAGDNGKAYWHETAPGVGSPARHLQWGTSRCGLEDGCNDVIRPKDKQKVDVTFAGVLKERGWRTKLQGFQWAAESMTWCYQRKLNISIFEQQHMF